MWVLMRWLLLLQIISAKVQIKPLWKKLKQYHFAIGLLRIYFILFFGVLLKLSLHTAPSEKVSFHMPEDVFILALDATARCYVEYAHIVVNSDNKQILHLLNTVKMLKRVMARSTAELCLRKDFQDDLQRSH